MASKNHEKETANAASNGNGRPLFSMMIHFLHHRPPTWLAIAIGAGTGALAGAGIGLSFGGWWLPAITLLGILLGSISSLDLLLPRPDWVPSLEGTSAERYAGPFQSVSALLFGGIVLLAAGVFFTNTTVSVRLARLPDGRVECWNVVKFLGGYIDRSSRTVGVQVVKTDARGEVLLETEDGRTEFLGALSKDHVSNIQTFLESQEESLELAGPRWIRYLSPGFFLAAGILFWMATRVLRRSILRLTEELRSAS